MYEGDFVGDPSDLSFILYNYYVFCVTLYKRYACLSLAICMRETMWVIPLICHQFLIIIILFGVVHIVFIYLVS